MTMRLFTVAALSAAAMLGASTLLLHAQAPTRNIWDGVYTAAQADRGKALFTDNCTKCHGSSLQGNDPAPALKGYVFMSDWEGQSVGDLAQRIHTSMPMDNPGSLSNAKTADVIAYLLQQNGLPAGASELSSDQGVQSQFLINALKPDAAP